MHDDLDIKSLVADLRVVRVRYELPDTAAFVRYQPAYDEDPNNLKVHHYDGELPLSCSNTGSFSLKELVNELRYAYVLVHLFPDESAMNFIWRVWTMGWHSWSSSVAPMTSTASGSPAVSPIWGCPWLSSSANATQ